MSVYTPAREVALTPRNIKPGWSKAGLYPFNPDRIPQGIQKPLAELSIPKADEVKVGHCSQGELQTPVTARGSYVATWPNRTGCSYA
jgi:hypothetical protein